MDMARVVGTVVATRKVESLHGIRMFFLQKLNENKEPVGRPFIGVDPLRVAGEGDLVFYVDGGDATMAFPDSFTPTDASIVGIVDNVDLLDKRQKENKE
jgi:ethanolamine utilization protein EutN